MAVLPTQLGLSIQKVSELPQRAEDGKLFILETDYSFWGGRGEDEPLEFLAAYGTLDKVPRNLLNAVIGMQYPRKGGNIEGDITPIRDGINLGAPDQPFQTLYCKEVIGVNSNGFSLNKKILEVETLKINTNIILSGINFEDIVSVIVYEKLGESDRCSCRDYTLYQISGKFSITLERPKKYQIIIIWSEGV